ncbi:pleiotropic regulatory protein RsmS [Photobacterium rosenbergii]|uniref:pleiotropic regulatory protein RsmS n=1 Tax=Photobacterium rosenbergii TaxID=294936 RepID=UPI001C9A1806|nr:pleiotropic regulatory protein RsmS [Photobacterium rosenbergii]MBY5949054.1 pleiotropic regulatory protein RsmS [Photobacterium rosenbergii]
MTEPTSSSLDNAPEDIKLAVDLIYLLESNEIDPETALSALEIVKSDLKAKVQAQKKANEAAEG